MCLCVTAFTTIKAARSFVCVCVCVFDGGGKGKFPKEEKIRKGGNKRGVCVCVCACVRAVYTKTYIIILNRKLYS